jgi:DNA repair protein RecN (Recombination protein N)
MIKHLHIRNFAIIEELDMAFPQGLTIITGETGAGKSILLGALGLIMGKRADIKSLHNLQSKCVVEALFDTSAYELNSFFATHELDYDGEEVIIRREISPSGKSRAFVNDSPVTLNVLQDLSSSLIDLHEQFDTLDIHEVSFQLRMIDALAENKALLHSYQTEFHTFQQDQKELNRLEQQERDAAKETDFITFQLEELDNAELVAGEQGNLEEELNRLSNAELIKRTLAAGFQRLSEDELSIIGQLEEVAQGLSGIKGFSSDLGALYERYQGLLIELQDLAQDLESMGEDTEYDEERIQELQTKVDAIYRLEKKHQVTTVEELIAIRDDLRDQLQGFDDLSGQIERLKGSLVHRKENLAKLADELHARRKAVIPAFLEKVHGLLQSLSMEHARLEVDIQLREGFTSTGRDEIQFLFAANKGSRLQPIKDVASGGELSRLTLVTKSLVASAIPLPTLIFDEIDTGISGGVALKMGEILRKLSDQHQVIVITHSPQVASRADLHYFVYKAVKEDRTVTGVQPMSDEQRIRAIATMLSQDPPSPSALENAKELLNMQ